MNRLPRQNDNAAMGAARSDVRSECALFRLGFRPFFLFGTFFGTIPLGYFILVLSGAVSAWPSAWDVLVWHRHEMLFGYTAAIIAGFLFTAVPNWTGHPAPKGSGLAAIVVLWVAGRVSVLFSSHLPPMLVAAVDSYFFLACAAGILPALVRSGNRRNYFFVVLLVLLAIANGLTHWPDEESHLPDLGLQLGLNVIILMMVIIGGRVIPFFTERPLGISIPRLPTIERVGIATALLALIAHTAAWHPVAIGVLSLLAAAINGWRLYGWKGLHTLRIPLLWVLHAGYAWLVLGFAVRGISELGGNVPSIVVTHTFTAGAISVLTLGMMARVSLGHTGRPLSVGMPMTLAFLCVNMAALLRVFGVWFFPDLVMRWLEISSVLWLLAFSIFIFIYAPILWRPRLDGRDG